MRRISRIEDRRSKIEDRKSSRRDSSDPRSLILDPRSAAFGIKPIEGDDHRLSDHPLRLPMRAPPAPGQLFPVFRRVADGKGEALSFEKPAGKVIRIAAVSRASDTHNAFPCLLYRELHDPLRLRCAARAA